MATLVKFIDLHKVLITSFSTTRLLISHQAPPHAAVLKETSSCLCTSYRRRRRETLFLFSKSNFFPLRLGPPFEEREIICVVDKFIRALCLLERISLPTTPPRIT